MKNTLMKTLHIRKSTFVEAEMILTNILIQAESFLVLDQISNKNKGGRRKGKESALTVRRQLVTSCLLEAPHFKDLIQTCRGSELSSSSALSSKSSSCSQLRHCKTQIVLAWAGPPDTSCRRAKGCSAFEQKYNLNLQLSCTKRKWLSTWLICISWRSQVVFWCAAWIFPFLVSSRQFKLRCNWIQAPEALGQFWKLYQLLFVKPTYFTLKTPASRAWRGGGERLTY